MISIDQPFVRACLIGLGLALLMVGVASGTVLRHAVQVLPIVVALVLLQYRAALGAYAALPIFVFWTGIVILIWLFLLGFSRVASGRYTSIEIVMTFVMVICSVAGAAGSIRLGRSLAVSGRVTAFVLSAALQVAAMWASLLRPIADR